ncbi:MAG: MFS transporter [Microlunatus sp.]|nr:MFS transporter [Microlunatus sp.]
MTHERREAHDFRDARTGLLILSLAVFVAVTTELLPVGLLPQISAPFAVPDARTGLLVSAYAIMVAVLAVPLTLATRRLPRKPLLLATLGCYVVSNLAAAAAPTFALLAAWRVVGGVAHALFFSICIGYAARLVSPALTGRAMALVSVGISGGLVVGVPLSTALGTAFGWRAAFACLGALVAVVLCLAAAVLPPIVAPVSRGRDHPGRRRDLATVVAANGLTYLGHFVLYTFISTLLLASGAGPTWVGPFLLVFGLCGLGGLRTAAAQLDARPWASALAIPAVMALGITAVGLVFPALWPVVVAVALWSTAFGPVASLYQSAAVRIAAVSPELAGAWINASANTGIAAGAAVGGAVLEAYDLRTVVWVAAALVASAALIALLARPVFESPRPLGHDPRTTRHR